MVLNQFLVSAVAGCIIVEARKKVPLLGKNTLIQLQAMAAGCLTSQEEKQLKNYKEDGYKKINFWYFSLLPTY